MTNYYKDAIERKNRVALNEFGEEYFDLSTREKMRVNFIISRNLEDIISGKYFE